MTERSHAPFVKSQFFPILVFLIAILVYAPSLANQFLWDDEVAIVQNQLIHSLANLPKFFTSGIFNTYGSSLSGGFYRPLTTTVMAILWSITSSPWIFRLFQITMHGLVATALFFVLRRFFPPTMALLGSVLFSIHPGISEAVLWISTIADPLTALFLLSAFLAIPTKPRLAATLFFLSLLFKEGSLVYGPLLLVWTKLTHPKKLLQISVWLGIATVVYATLRIGMVGFSFQDNLVFPSPIAKASLLERLMSVPFELVSYLKTFFWPIRLSISQHFVVTRFTDTRFWAVSPLLLVGLAVLLFKRSKSDRTSFFLLWFFVGLLPYLQLIPLSATVADRWLYLPSIGLIGIVLWAIKRIPRRISIVVIAGIVLFFSFLTIQRNLQWRNGLTLFSHDITINPDSFDLQNNYGVELFRSGSVEIAKAAFERSVALNPHWWVAYNNLGAIAQREGNFAQAKQYYQTSMEKGSYYLAYENLAQLLLFHLNDPKAAYELAKAAAAAFPGSLQLLLVYSVSSYRLGNQQEALQVAQTLYRLFPTPQTANIVQRIINNQPLE